MLKKLLLVSLMILSLICIGICANAEEAICSQIVYTDADGNILTSYTEGEITAKAVCTNTTNSPISPVLLVCSYKDGMMNGVWYSDAQQILAGEDKEIKTVFTPVAFGEGTEIKATLLDSLKSLDPYLESAVMLNNTTALKGIKVDGAFIEDYSDEVDSYVVQCPDVDSIEAFVTDSGTTVSITRPESLPGYADIKVTSAFGDERDIKILLYNSPEQLYSLKTVMYEAGGVEYAIDWFEPDVTEYEIELDDNTFYVTVNPVVFMEDAEVRVKVQDIDHTKKTFGSVKYVNGSFVTAYTTTTYGIRKAFNNVIPIKNEATKAVIDVEYDGNVRTYTLTFVSRQPRLTSFNITEGALADSYQPSFMGGAAVNNDNGTTTGTDRAWSVVNVSKEFIGGSMFMLPAASNKETTTWYGSADGDEYFNFTTDTPGTIYMVMYTDIIDDELTENYANDGWVQVQNKMPTGFSKIDNFNGLGVDFNDYPDNEYTLSIVEFQNADQRYNMEDSYVIPAAGLTSYRIYSETYKREFEAGEQVSIYHIGASTHSTLAIKSLIQFIIKWDIEE